MDFNSSNCLCNMFVFFIPITQPKNSAFLVEAPSLERLPLAGNFLLHSGRSRARLQRLISLLLISFSLL